MANSANPVDYLPFDPETAAEVIEVALRLDAAREALMTYIRVYARLNGLDWRQYRLSDDRSGLALIPQKEPKK